MSKRIKIGNIILLVFLLFSTVVGGLVYGISAKGSASEDIIQVNYPIQNSVVNVDSDSMTEYFNSDIDELSKFLNKGELITMKSVQLEWTCGNGMYYEVYVADNLFFKNTEKYVCIDNFLQLSECVPNSEYYWKVKVTDKKGNQKFSKVYKFKTEGHIRNVPIDGVSNVRDLGGSQTADGKIMKYGLIYRSAKGENITENGKRIIKKLGIRTDMDLRGSKAAQKGSPFGDELKLLVFNGAYYANCGFETGLDGSEEYRNAFRDELKACAIADNYPMIFHCSLGRDRTGTLAFILEALCGVDKEILFRNHMLSFLTVDGQAGGTEQIDIILSKINTMYDYIDGFEGDTFSEKTANLVKELGITEQEISSIKNILVG